VRHHGPVATTGRRRLRSIRYGTIEQRVRVAHGAPTRRSACLRRTGAAAALDRDGRVRPLRQPGGRAASVRLVRRTRHFLSTVAQRGHVFAHHLRELPVHGDRGSRRTTALRFGATRQTGAGVRKHAPHNRTIKASAGEPSGRRWHSFDRSPTTTHCKYEQHVTFVRHHIFFISCAQHITIAFISCFFSLIALGLKTLIHN